MCSGRITDVLGLFWKIVTAFLALLAQSLKCHELKEDGLCNRANLVFASLCQYPVHVYMSIQAQM